jgi:hypothetical protein
MIIPMRLAKSFQQPAASLICQGFWRSASCAQDTAHRGEVLIHASQEPMDAREFEMPVHAAPNVTIAGDNV